MQRPAVIVLGLVGLLVAAAVVLQTGLWIEVLGTGEYEEGTVTVREASDAVTPTATQPSTDTSMPETTIAAREQEAGEPLGTVEVRIAQTFDQRYVGLSKTESLGPDEGMLFVHDEEGQHTYVMRNMSFPIDIIFIDANGTITAIHHAPLPPEGTSESGLTGYEGRGKYVLEVNRGWANRTGVEVGDRVELPPEAM
ncbi:hypothetical protein HISP_14085 [Haloarcula hispanica N601]|uniref:DUF192 domain-containing protein n=2 Tax=Haloarcula hispanica TaxID=51589 RepID=V5TP54_HALHI|nr:DUF192 domain-containing protein [Haloarcula hispanica]AEM58353.1 conserved hypothetical protein [Haloarcula hispanica ATCC 33960]AHB67086.1 hypothetical protein HISP_14085 [Haloarcula hispanica N601]